MQVRLERVNSHVEIVVSDTGIGISPDFLPYVFERFRQAEAGTTRKTGGLGLGLAIVRHIVEMHGGTVEASSAGEGQGATFRVRLPLMIVQPEAVEPRREHPRTERREALTGLGDLERRSRVRDRRRGGCAEPAARRAGDRRRRGDDRELPLTRARTYRRGEAGCPGCRSRHARDGRLRVDYPASQIAGQGDSPYSRRGADRLCAIRRSHEGAAQWLRNAPRQAGRSRRIGRLRRDARQTRRSRLLSASISSSMGLARCYRAREPASWRRVGGQDSLQSFELLRNQSPGPAGHNPPRDPAEQTVEHIDS